MLLCWRLSANLFCVVDNDTRVWTSFGLRNSGRPQEGAWRMSEEGGADRRQPSRDTNTSAESERERWGRSWTELLYHRAIILSTVESEQRQTSHRQLYMSREKESSSLHQCCFPAGRAGGSHHTAVAMWHNYTVGVLLLGMTFRAKGNLSNTFR